MLLKVPSNTLRFFLNCEIKITHIFIFGSAGEVLSFVQAEN